VSGEAFHNALAQALEFWGGDEMVPNYDDASVILAMPEMQAIRKFIEDTAINNGIGVDDGSSSFWKANDGTWVSQSVIDWALGGPS